MTNFLKSFIRDESGATAIEYALIAAVVGIGILTGAQGLKDTLNAKNAATGTALTAAQ